MTTSYTSLLGLALPTTGELQGTWGDTVNNSITSLLDSAVAGTTTLSTDGDVTLTTTTGASNQARQAILLCSGARTAIRTITAPAQSKIYTIINATTGGYAVKIVGVGPTTGISIPAGQTAQVAWNGSDFVDASNYTNGNKYINGNLTVAGSVTLSGGTANGVAYLNGSKVLTTGSALTFDGTNLGIGTSTPLAKLHVAGGDIGIDIDKKLILRASDPTAAFLTYTASTTIRTYLQSQYGIFLGKDYGAGNGLYLDATGNLGLGVTPSAWAGEKALQLQFGAIASGYNYSVEVASIAYRDNATWKYQISSQSPTLYEGISGQHRWYTAPSGTAGDPISFTQAMTLDASGNLGVGTTSPAFRLDLKGSGATSFAQMQDSTAVYKAIYGVDSGGGVEGAVAGALTNHPFILRTNNTERARIDSSGNFGIGTSSPGQKLDVVGNGKFRGAAPSIIAEANNGTQAAIQLTQVGVGNWLKYFRVSDSALVEQFGGTDLLFLTTAGNLGLGVTPSAWAAPFKAIQMGNGAGFAGRNDTTVAAYMASNYYYNSGDKYIGTGNATLYIQTGGAHTWYTAPSGTAGNPITFTQAMTLDASGNLGIGTSSPGERLSLAGAANVYASITTTGGVKNQIFSSDATGGGGLGTVSNHFLALYTNNTERARIDSSGNFGIGTNSPSTRLSVVSGTNAGISVNDGTVNTILYNTGSVNGTVGTTTNHPFSFYTNNAERMRIDTSGNLLVGQTSVGQAGVVSIKGSNGYGVEVTGNGGGALNADYTYGSGTGYYGYFKYGGTVVGSITSTGAATAYNTTSDYRLKDNQQPLTGSGAFIDALQPKTWKWKADGSKGVGFIAHEVQEVSPGSVVGEKDAVDEDGKPKYQAMEYGSAEFIANIVAELQSLRARVAALEAK